MSRSTAFGKVLAAGLMAGFVVPAAPSAGLVERTGTDFTVDGSRVRFVGHNNYQLTSDRRANKCGRVLSDRRVKKLLRQAKSAGASLIRTWFFQQYFLQAGKSWEPFDRVLEEARRIGLKVVPVLVNHFPDCEPSRGRSKNQRFYASGFRKPGWRYPMSYKAWARMVARHYRNDPTIAFWQLVNEAETSSEGVCNRTPEPERFGNNLGRSANILRAFADEMTRTLKHVDPNHLVSLGTIGSGQCGTQEDEYQFVHAGRVDLCENHDYGDVTQAIPDDGFNRLRQRIDQCNALGKPLVVGEAGIVADVADDGQSTGSITIETLGRRAALFNAKLSAAFAEGIDGYFIWEKIPDASNSNYNFNNGRFGVGPSDPLNAVTRQHPDGSESVILLNPADSLCSGLAVNFQWTIESQRPGRIYCSSIITDKGLNPFDGFFEDIFDAGQSTSLLLSLNPFFYDPADFQWGVRVTVCNGLNDTCPCEGEVLESEVRNLQTSSQPSSCH